MDWSENLIQNLKRPVFGFTFLEEKCKICPQSANNQLNKRMHQTLLLFFYTYFNILFGFDVQSPLVYYFVWIWFEFFFPVFFRHLTAFAKYSTGSDTFLFCFAYTLLIHKFSFFVNPQIHTQFVFAFQPTSFAV